MYLSCPTHELGNIGSVNEIALATDPHLSPRIIVRLNISRMRLLPGERAIYDKPVSPIAGMRDTKKFLNVRGVAFFIKPSAYLTS